MNLKLLLIILLSVASPLFAAALSDAPVFDTPEAAERYQQLIKETRCPTCQNSDIAESSAPLARQLRAQIAKQVQSGKTNAEITTFLRERYGDFITYNPPIKASTMVLWFAPFVAMFAALLWFVATRQRNHARKQLSAYEKAELQKWLNEYQP